MNFFSHIYFAKEELSPLYAAGLLYPDLNRKKKREQFPNAEFQKGIEEHIESATLLHSQEWFKEAQVKLADSHEGLKFKFKSHLYHWAMELSIDYFLLKEVPESLPTEYEKLLRAPQTTEFLMNHDMNAAGYLHLLIQNKRLGSYKTVRGCVEALKRTHSRVITMYPQLKTDIQSEWYRIVMTSQTVVEPRMGEVKALFPYK